MNEHKGFSLIELLIVVVIIGIVAAIAIPNLMASRRAANEGSAIASLRTLYTANATFAATQGNGDYAGDAGSVNSSAMTALQTANLIDETLGTGTKSNYRFIGDRVAKSDSATASFYIAANPVTAAGVERTGNRRFGVSNDGIVKYDGTYANLGTPFDATTLLLPLALPIGE